MVQDFLATQTPKYRSLVPTIAMASFSQSLVYYKLTYTLADFSVWEVLLSINLDTFVVRQEAETLILSASLPPVEVYERVRSSMVYLDFMYILFIDRANTQFNNKYKESAVQTLEKYEDSAMVKYRATLTVQGVAWLVIGQVSKSTFAVTGLH